METINLNNDQNVIKLDLPWTREDIANVFLWEKHGIDYYTLGTRLYLTVRGNIEGIDKDNSIKNILISEDHKTLLIVLNKGNNNLLPDNFTYKYNYKYENKFTLKYCKLDEITIEENNNHISYNESVYNKLYVVPDKVGNLKCGKIKYIVFPNEKLEI